TGQTPAPVDLAAPEDIEQGRVVAWMHMGGPSNYQVLPSQRYTDKDGLPGAPKLPRSKEPLPKPEDVFTADLGGGVSCRVPLSLYTDAKGTRPKATTMRRPSGKPKDFPLTGDDRSTRLGGVVVAWNIFQHFYPYLAEVKTDWPAMLGESLATAA